ncbi:hypothetical protein CDD81_6141 [Ophiocordyceps australis]|uniref:Uncharacterized protein n=1 Tax=Ophiocordyceps australis TaxID=1399860 RepID=A0A2C5Y8J9_9HYPO|nr:hypothetical protein CDD81_6141 [Ophiocordyceps australis]
MQAAPPSLKRLKAQTLGIAISAVVETSLRTSIDSWTQLDLPDVRLKLSHGSLCWGGMQNQKLRGHVMLKAVIVARNLAQQRGSTTTEHRDWHA